jgi:putative aminopeptidase FrvX
MNKKFLIEYLNGYSPTSLECEGGQQIWIDYIKPFVDEITVDVYGNAIGVINPESDYKVVLDAHADEIAWVIKHIDDNGYIYPIRNGGSDPQIAPSKKVIIHTSTGEKIRGVFGWTPIHMRHTEDRKNIKPEMKSLFIDVGATSKDELSEMGIGIGDSIIFDEQPEYMGKDGNRLVSKSIDDKIGGFIHSQVLEKIYKNKDKLPYGLYVVNSVQEEIGLKGAKMAAEGIKPNVAICFDVCHDTNIPTGNKKIDGDFKLGGGVVVAQDATTQRNLLKLIKDVASENEIPVNMSISTTGGGTNASSYAYANGGVATSLLSIPLKYMHTTVEMVDLQDVEKSISLIYNVIKKIEYMQDYR